MSKEKGLYTEDAETFGAKVDGIPLTDVDATQKASIGSLVSNATSQMSSLFRSEIELAKAEIAGEAKKGAIGGGLFGAAAAVALYSSFFFFFFLAELLSKWLDRWAAFLIVFVIMLALAGLLALFGLRKVKKIGAPKQTIDSVGELKKLVPGKASKQLDSKNKGMFS